MKNSILLGTLVIAMALVPSFAAATNTAYAEVIGGKGSYTVPGTLLVMPTLSQDHGTAQINNPVFLGTSWSLEVECLSTSTENCDGFIVS